MNDAWNKLSLCPLRSGVIVLENFVLYLNFSFKGLMEFQFQLNYNTTKLDEWSLTSLTLSGIIAGKRRKANDSDSLEVRERYLKGTVNSTS